jgi:membrane protease YdiL (CAAX protease family)
VKAIAVVMVGSLVTGALAVVTADSLLEPGQDYDDNASALTIILLANLLAQELLLLGALAWFTIRKYHVSLATLGLVKPERITWWFPVALTVAALALLYGYVALMSQVGWTEADPGPAATSPGPLIVVVVAAVFMAPVIEELFFRGFLFGGLEAKWGWVTAAIVSSLLFSAAHVSPFAFVPFAGIGFLFAWSYHHTGSITSSIFAHTIVNVVAFAILAAG